MPSQTNSGFFLEKGGKENTGLYVGLFNACSLLSQLLINLIASGVLVLADQVGTILGFALYSILMLSLLFQDVAWGIAFGTVFAFCATTMVSRL